MNKRYCCHVSSVGVDCPAPPIFEIQCGGNQLDVLDACKEHVGELLTWPVDGAAPEYWTVRLIEAAVAAEGEAK